MQKTILLALKGASPAEIKKRAPATIKSALARLDGISGKNPRE